MDLEIGDFCYGFGNRRFLLRFWKSELSATDLEIGDFCYGFGNRRFLLRIWKSEISATDLEIGAFCYGFGNRSFLLRIWKSEISATDLEIGAFCYGFGNRRFLLRMRKSEISATDLEIGDFCYGFGNRSFLLRGIDWIASQARKYVYVEAERTSAFPTNGGKKNMNPSTRLLLGNSVTHNQPPVNNNDYQVKLTGTYTGRQSAFTLNNTDLSKHTMLIGGTGCGKTTLFYHFVSQIKKNMSKDDVMIIFDSKGDFYNKFYAKNTDLVIGNSKQYSSQSELWNNYKEILADGWEEHDFIINTQEICKSFFEERTKNTTNAFFPNAARDLLAAIIIAFIREGKKDTKVKQDFFYNNKLKEFLDLSDMQMIMDLLGDSPEANAVMIPFYCY